MSASPGRQAHILVVDDERAHAQSAAEVVRSTDGLNLEVHLAHSVEAAGAVIAKLADELDLTVVDLRLPDGLRMLASWRAHARFAEFLVLTEDASVESVVAAVGAGVFAYVLKPFHPQELQGTVARAIEQVARRREADRLRSELEASEKRHREVAHAVPAFVLAVDAEGKIILWNRQLETVTGYSQVEMLGRDGSPFVDGDGVRSLERRNGARCLVRWQSTKVRADSTGCITYGLGIDVTEEQELLRRTLRTERLAAVGTLSAGLAHEVRNPLNSAVLQLQVLKRRIENGNRTKEELVQVASLVEEEIERVERLVSDFLAFARPKEVELEPRSLNELLRDLVALMRPEFEAANIRVECRLDETLGPVDIEPKRMQQVFLNLLRNAQEAMLDGGAIVLSTGPAERAGYARAEVEDTGGGFDENQPIFDAFFTTKAKGTGLGLSIAHGIVSEHGGTIQADSLAHGARFTVSLPLHQEQDERTSGIL